MRVLVVGGAGYIGGAVTDLLLERKIPFAVRDMLLYESHYLKPVPFERIPATSPIDKKFTHVIWLAAVVGDAACDRVPKLTLKTNQEDVRWLAENFKGRVIFTSTCSVYGEHHGEVSEGGPTNPLSLYAKTKLAAESYLTPKNALILRLGTVYGISDTYSRPRMDLVGNYMPVVALTKGIITVNGGEQWRPMVHVWDVAKVIVGNLETKHRGIFNIANTNIRMKALAAITAKLTGAKVEVVPLSGDTRNYEVNVGKAFHKGVISSAMYPLGTPDDGIHQFVKLIREGRIKDPNSSQYFNARHLPSEAE
jgi:nucleoside-diphosphate-sugar epimerase